MYFRNELLFNNAFLNRLSPSDDERGAMYALVRGARDWFRRADFATPQATVDSFVRPLLQTQSLDLRPVDGNPHAFLLVAPWEPETPLGLLYAAPRGEDLDGRDESGRVPKGRHWMAQTVRQAQQAGMRWAVLTDGSRWRLLHADGLRRYEACLEIRLEALVQAESSTPEFDLAAYLFSTLFRLENAFARAPEGERCGLDDFLEASRHDTERIERHLKQTVTDSLETPGGGDGIMAQLCVGLVKAIDPQGRRAFSEAERDAIYRDATYLLYRLLFILYAEARQLLPAENPDYQPVSLGRLLEDAADLRSDPDRAAARPTSLWDALSALFNFVDVGDSPTHIPAFDGGLFDNASRRYLRQCKIANTYLAPALFQLAYLSDPKTGELERIDYRDLSVRHLGSLYEGMIEYRLFIAEQDLLARQEKEGQVRYLPVQGSARKANDELVPAGRVYFAQSPHERKATGTHYTVEELVERLVRQTVLRLLDERWAAFEPQLHKWLAELESLPTAERQAALRGFIDNRLLEFVQAQVLSLRLCDPAMGSGHFLVHVAHQITNFILKVLTSTSWENPEIDLSPAAWRQRVVEQCLYGVDINPMAVELAKLSLWLATMQAGRPLTFLDHHLKAGNSLLGVSLEEIAALVEQSAFNQDTRQARLAQEKGQLGFRQQPQVQQRLAQALEILERIAARPVTRLEDAEAQAADYAAIQALLQPYKQVGDLIVAQKMGWKAKEAGLRPLAQALAAGAPETLDEAQAQLLAQAQELLGAQRTFHWALEFPQVFLRLGDGPGGFDVVIGNPPFLGGSRISGEIGLPFLEYLHRAFINTGGVADLCAYFFRKAFEVLKDNGYLGMVATNTIGQGDTRESGLAQIVTSGGVIYFASRFVQWMGFATVEVNLVCITKGNSIKDFLLDERHVQHISSRLEEGIDISVHRLYQNRYVSFKGDDVWGIGFVIPSEEAYSLIRGNENNRQCIFPFINGKELNNSPEQSPSRHVICFHDWPLDKAATYPELLDIVRERVKPGREKINRARNRERWWLFGEYRKGLRNAVRDLEKVLARAIVSELHMLTFLPKGYICANTVSVLAFDDYYHFGLLQSILHEIWLRKNASTLRTDIRYTSTDCFETFPFPQDVLALPRRAAEQAGQAYYEHRQGLMQQAQLGLTKTYNRFHDPACQDAEIQELRRLHAEMDRAVLACYGWEDIHLGHDFYPNDRKKIRYMPSRAAQREIFTRLLALNQQIAAQEAAQGLAVEDGEEEDGDEDAT